MSGTTTRHAFPWPSGSDTPSIHTAIKGLADAADAQVPVVTTNGVAPSPLVNGLMWYDTSTGNLQISDGSTWFLIEAGVQSYTPSLTASTTNPTLGSGSGQFGRYIEVSKLVRFEISINVGGAGFNPGSGTYRFGLPVPANVPNSNMPLTGIARIFDSSAGQFATMDLRFDGTASGYIILTSTGARGVVAAESLATSSSPVTPASSDQYLISGVYEAA